MSALFLKLLNITGNGDFGKIKFIDNEKCMNARWNHQNTLIGTNAD
jgi:hypothetical protein